MVSSRLYFELNPRKVSAATIERDRISARSLVRIIGKNTLPEKIDEPIALRYRTTRARRSSASKKEWMDFEEGREKRRYPLHVPIALWALEQVRDVEPSDDGYVRPSRQTGGVLTRVHDVFVDAVEASGVRRFSSHDLRTTDATWLREVGIDELVIELLLGTARRSIPLRARSARRARTSPGATRGSTKRRSMKQSRCSMRSAPRLVRCRRPKKSTNVLRVELRVCRSRRG